MAGARGRFTGTVIGWAHNILAGRQAVRYHVDMAEGGAHSIPQICMASCHVCPVPAHLDTHCYPSYQLVAHKEPQPLLLRPILCLLSGARISQCFLPIKAVFKTCMQVVELMRQKSSLGSGMTSAEARAALGLMVEHVPEYASTEEIVSGRVTYLMLLLSLYGKSG